MATKEIITLEGKQYFLEGIYGQNKNAKRRAKYLRKREKYNARVVKRSKSKFAVYTRPKVWR